MEEAAAPQAAPMPADELALRAALLAMDPSDFERHVTAFFEKAGLKAVVTPRSGDYGLDGYAEHPEGLLVVRNQERRRRAQEREVGCRGLKIVTAMARNVYIAL